MYTKTMGNGSFRTEAESIIVPYGATTAYKDTHLGITLSFVNALTNNFVGTRSAWSDIFRSNGVIFDAAGVFSSNTNHAGFIGLYGNASIATNMFTGSFAATDKCIGIGRNEGDAANAVYLMIGDGTSISRTILTRTDTGYGASSDMQFRVNISIAPGSDNAIITVQDLYNGYPCLDAYTVSIASFPSNCFFAAINGSATGASNSVISHIFWEMSYYAYPGQNLFGQSASNIMGNAATATALATPRNIQGVSFNGSAAIDIISIGSVAPSTPNVNQLWIQTA